MRLILLVAAMWNTSKNWAYISSHMASRTDTGWVERFEYTKERDIYNNSDVQ